MHRMIIAKHIQINMSAFIIFRKVGCVGIGLGLTGKGVGDVDVVGVGVDVDVDVDMKFFLEKI